MAAAAGSPGVSRTSGSLVGRGKMRFNGTMRTRCWHARWGGRGWLILLALVCPVAAPGRGPGSSLAAPAGYHLVWHDEFDGTALDRQHWQFDTGPGFIVKGPPGQPATVVRGWGNNELECYTDRPANAYVADGALHLRAIREARDGSDYTSARLRSGGKGSPALFVHRYGRVEWRAKLPTGQGYWPALWLLPQDDAYGTWAASGEIDVMENRGSEPGIVQGTIHYGGSWPKNVWSGQQYRLPNNGSVAEWHVYGLDWEPGRLRWSVDGVVYAARDFWWSATAGKPNPWPAPFDRPFFLVMNLAVGGQFGGDPSADTRFPQEMLVDYVRVYDRDGPLGPVPPPGPGRVADLSVVHTVK